MHLLDLFNFRINEPSKKNQNIFYFEKTKKATVLKVDVFIKLECVATRFASDPLIDSINFN